MEEHSGEDGLLLTSTSCMHQILGVRKLLQSMVGSDLDIKQAARLSDCGLHSYIAA
jgi:hypothetical protein